jgi:peptide/nickel transport system substrate-binding protein
MKSLRKGILYLGIVSLVIFLGISSTGWAKDPEKVIIIGDYSVIKTLDPAALTLSQETMIARNIYQTVVRFKFNSSEIEGDLAKSWTVSKDGLVYTFDLRDDVQWHKGFGKFTAQDVKYTFDRLLDPKTGLRERYSELAGVVKDVKVTGDYTVEFHLKSTYAPFLARLATFWGVPIVKREAVEKFGKDFGRNPIGTGPFVFDSWTREECVVVANKDFKQRQGPPKVDKVVYKIIPDPDTSILTLLKGDIDMIWVIPREKALVDRFVAAGLKVKITKRPILMRLLMNTKKKPFSDVQVRRAIAHAIDKDSLVTHVFGGIVERIDTHIADGTFGHATEGIPRYNYDPEKAKKLLAEAGYPNGFEVNLDTFQSPSYLPLATALVEQLRKVNITVKLVVTDQNVWISKMSQGTTDFTLQLPPPCVDADQHLTLYYHSASFSPGFNVAKYDKIDDLIEKARTEIDPKKRLQIYHQIQVKLMEDVPTIPLLSMHMPIPYKANIAGIPERDCNWGFDYYQLHFVDKK